MEDNKLRYMLEPLDTMSHSLSNSAQGQDLNTEEVNQQATVTTTELAWLAGFWDGEGHIGLVNAPVKGRNRIQQTMTVVNTHTGTIEYVIDILKRLNVTYYIYESGGNDKHKPRLNVKVARLESVHRLLTAIEPYLFTKKLQAGLLLRFVTRRVESSSKRMTYNDEDYYLYNELRSLNAKGWREPQRLHAKSGNSPL